MKGLHDLIVQLLDLACITQSIENRHKTFNEIFDNLTAWNSAAETACRLQAEG